MLLLVLVLPWLGVIAFLLLAARTPRELPAPSAAGPGRLVSVIVPARNEATNIETCVRSIVGSRGVDFEVIVVDDRSDDDTSAIVAKIDAGNSRRLEVIRGTELPEGWLGKPWACAQGAAAARGAVLLFTDADTRHGPDLLARALAGLDEEGADLLTVMGHQELGSFWERLVQPQIFLSMILRYPRLEQMARDGHWRNGIANGQYMLFTRTAYDGLGGHASVRDEVAEDLAMAQWVKRSGRKLRIRRADPGLSTRMYRSLGQMIEGWSKNLLMGGMQSLPPALRTIALPATVVASIMLWIVPPIVLVAALAGMGGDALLAWSATTTAVGALVWTTFSLLMGVPAGYGLLYPLGASVATWIFLRSWRRGRDVEWKGRRYRLPPLSSRP